ncbi:MDR family MFS transporter [Tengunoibacter tsumagoiensis]|uniref:Major facilitator superfamily (MFS) profile domain-containing protein n=1 Tax=Tengunoibacter tsumagoiensis TaxID=2014871 RepID=A0A402A850_9CHLR|nr:MDR family MFS transporter [Tengunoibacter tsumagoiensis]GCE15259.1 hypothetical protein KTT_51180 [Tengunoibacter tsumagoiensis]
MGNTIQEHAAVPSTQTSPLTQPQKPRDYSRKQVLTTMGGLLLALFFIGLDQNITGTAMPHIIGEFHGFDRFTWVSTAFMLTSTVMIPIYGKLSDLFGRKGIFLTGLSIFLLGSACCGMAQSMDQLILFRAFQGLGAGGIMPVAMATFADLLPPQQRARMQGGMMGIFTFSTILGPVIGGWITDHISWRWVFYINLPFILLVLIGLLLLMPRLRQSHVKARIDFIGAALLILGVVPILLGFSWAGTFFPWLSWQIPSLLGGGVLLLILLGFYEVHLGRSGGEPIIDPSLFKNRVFTISALNIMITFMGMIGSMAFLPLYAQGVLRISATNSGFLLMPMMISAMISSIISGQVASRTGHYKLLAIIGMTIIVAGGGAFLFLDVNSSPIQMIVAMALMGLGIGTSMALYSTLIVNSLPPHKIGQGVANMDFFQEMGGPIALSIIGPFLVAHYTPAYYAALPTAIKQRVPDALLKIFDKPDIVLNPSALHALAGPFSAFGQGTLDQVLGAVREGLTQGIHMAFLMGFCILLVGLVMVFFMPRVEIQKTPTE